MFKHLLLPTDGSLASEIAIHFAMPFAKEINARVTGVYVIPEYHVIADQFAMAACTKEQFDIESTALTLEFLAVIEREARQAGVICDTEYVVSAHPHEAIIKLAADKECDLIVMASHGRTGVRALMLGSETQKVLTHSRIPVLVLR
ncbi:universal stress family protein [Collimonas arenae]|uniref:Universal stress family protein n=1 Tax=Collimonas arenae TaxID=279058 RepID=A0A127PQQ6_9BURK|nr:universal stress protein [Collimonas arenae]AMP00140.1 universal stress family protein [Collimonas arenae]AMP10041.1 universal stress family protein [Collimonas arenae]